MAIRRLPILVREEAYSFQVELDNVFYGFTLRFNKRDNHWYMDIDQASVKLIVGIKVVTGDGLLSQFDHMQVDGRLPPGTFDVLDTVGERFNDPDVDSFGDTILFLYNEAS